MPARIIKRNLTDTKVHQIDDISFGTIVGQVRLSLHARACVIISGLEEDSLRSNDG